MNIQNEKIYIHRERGYACLPKEITKKMAWDLKGKAKQFSNYILSFVKFNKSDFGSNDDFRVFQIYIYWINTKSNKKITLGAINWKTGKMYFDTTYGLRKRFNELTDILIKEEIIKQKPFLDFSYIEICTRFSRQYYSQAIKLMSKIKFSFRTQWTNSSSRYHDSIGQKHIVILKKLLFNEYVVNLKIYLMLKFKREKYNLDYIMPEDFEKEPKIEVQIKGMKEAERAIEEAVPIILAFLHSIGCHSIGMTESIYERIRLSKKHLEPYYQICGYLGFNKNLSFVLPLKGFFGERIYERRAKILQFIAFKPHSVKEIKEKLKVSKGTIRKDLELMEKEGVVCSRGRSGVEKMFAPKHKGS